MTHQLISQQKKQSLSSSPCVQTSRFANRPFIESPQQKREQPNLQTILQRAERVGNPIARMAWEDSRSTVQRQGGTENAEQEVYHKKGEDVFNNLEKSITNSIQDIKQQLQSLPLTNRLYQEFVNDPILKAARDLKAYTSSSQAQDPNSQNYGNASKYFQDAVKTLITKVEENHPLGIAEKDLKNVIQAFNKMVDSAYDPAAAELVKEDRNVSQQERERRTNVHDKMINHTSAIKQRGKDMFKALLDEYRSFQSRKSNANKIG